MNRQERRMMEHEIQRTIARFFLYLDERRYEDLAALIASDGVWSRQGEQLKGPERVQKALEGRPAGLITRHVISNILTDMVDSEKADTSFYMTVFRHDGEQPPTGPLPLELPHVVAACRGRLSRIADNWVFNELGATPTFRR